MFNKRDGDNGCILGLGRGLSKNNKNKKGKREMCCCQLITGSSVKKKNTA